MRELTIDDLDAQLAEQLPARELMGCSPCKSYSQGQSTTISQGNVGSGDHDGNGDGNGLLSVGSGDADGNLDGDSVNVIL